MTHIFISYSKKDIAFARHLRNLLQDEGFAVWIDESGLTPSDRWWATIERNIIASAAFIVVMTPDAKESEWVEREILVAEDPDHKKPIFPVLLAGKPWALLGNIQHTDMTAGAAAALPPDFVKALHNVVLADTGQPIPPPAPAAAVTAPQRKPRRKTMEVVTAVVVVIIAVIVLARLITVAPLLNPTAVPTQSAAQPTSTATSIRATSTIPPSASATQAAARPTVTATAIRATSTIPPSASATAIPATVTASPSATLVPTVGNTPIPTVSANDQWKLFVKKFDDVDMVLVPPGCFMMGSNGGGGDEKPASKQCFATPFWIDAYEVTNAQFAAFVGQASLTSAWKSDNRPRERINWFEARNFCARRGVRLPTEAEWEYAARGPDGLNYPWGNRFVADNVVYAGNAASQTADVGSKPGGASWVGAFDMSGNVWEWVSTLYQPYPYSAADGRENGDDVKNPRVIRGGSWGETESLVSTTNRSGIAPSAEDYNVGFRCARSS